eukprot:2813888-Karenia_brevis.AAC.1
MLLPSSVLSCRIPSGAHLGAYQAHSWAHTSGSFSRAVVLGSTIPLCREGGDANVDDDDFDDD